MSPIPGEPLQPKAPELTMSDGRKVKLKLPGLEPQPEPEATEDDSAEPSEPTP